MDKIKAFAKKLIDALLLHGDAQRKTYRKLKMAPDASIGFLPCLVGADEKAYCIHEQLLPHLVAEIEARGTDLLNGAIARYREELEAARLDAGRDANLLLQAYPPPRDEAK